MCLLISFILARFCFIFSCYNIGLLLEELTAFCIIYLSDIVIKVFLIVKVNVYLNGLSVVCGDCDGRLVKYTRCYDNCSSFRRLSVVMGFENVQCLQPFFYQKHCIYFGSTCIQRFVLFS